ncbi:hypothetical protein C8J57DRAFT_1298036 [Mycena rebaudengoi]|nr:hypothetical protein C8J57DRAFT_1298036 [Mycena rebaudengoi]
MAEQKATEGLLFIYLEVGPDVKEADLNDWYDNEHAPLRLTVPGISSCTRYKAVDSNTPKWLTLYDLDTPNVANSEAYNALRAQGSDNEKAILSRIGGLSRQSFEHMKTYMHPETTADSLPGKYILVVHFEMPPEHEEDFNSWYREEHMDLLAKVPGWKRGRRYQLLDSNQKGAAMVDKPVSKFLAIHDMDNNQFMDTPEFKHATSTPWRVRVTNAAIRREARVFELYKSFAKPT